MNWYSNWMEKFKQTPDPYFSLGFYGKILGGIGLGMLLATWLGLPIWTGWIFIGVGVAMRIPAVKFLGKK
ncbi:hypothetical protein ES703_71100 [subsurface metagenome]